MGKDSTGPVPISPEGVEQISKGSGGRSQRVIDVPVFSFLEAKAIAESILRNQQVTAIACERSGSAQVFYAKTFDELRAWAERVRSGAL